MAHSLSPLGRFFCEELPIRYTIYGRARWEPDTCEVCDVRFIHKASLSLTATLLTTSSTALLPEGLPGPSHERTLGGPGTSSRQQSGLRTSVLDHIHRGHIRVGTVQGGQLGPASMVPAGSRHVDLGFSRQNTNTILRASTFPSTQVVY